MKIGRLKFHFIRLGENSLLNENIVVLVSFIKFINRIGMQPKLTQEFIIALMLKLR